MKLIRRGKKVYGDDCFDLDVEAGAIAERSVPQYVLYNDAHDYLLINNLHVPFWRQDPWSKVVIIKWGGRYYRLPMFFSVGAAFVDGSNPLKWPKYYTPAFYKEHHLNQQQ